MSEYDDLVRRVSALEAELAEAKKALEAGKPKPEFVPRAPMPKIDWTAGMKMPPSAVQAMARVVPDVKREPQTAEQVASSWARSRIGQPGGFGPANWDAAEQKERQRKAEEEAQRKAVEVKKAPRPFAEEQLDRIVEYWAGGPNDTSKLR